MKTIKAPQQSLKSSWSSVPFTRSKTRNVTIVNRSMARNGIPIVKRNGRVILSSSVDGY